MKGNPLLPRLRLFEFHECAWFPESLRNAITEVLRVMCFQLHVHEVILPVVEAALDRHGARQIVDLCSGAGGPILPIQQQLARSGRKLEVLLTDKFPNLRAFRRCQELTGGSVHGHPEPVSAESVPAQLAGVRTLFNAFHHFSPITARSILEDAYRSHQPLAIFEITERTVSNTILNFPLSFVAMLTLLPLMRNRRFHWWLFTYLIPILPLAFGWDASVSCLRSYSESEFNELKAGLEDSSYSWTSGRLSVPHSTIHVTYFIGSPSPTSSRTSL